MRKFGLALWMVLSLSSYPVVYAEQLATVEEAIHKVFPDATGSDRQDVCLSAEDVALVEEGASVLLGGSPPLKLARIIVRKDSRAIGVAIEDIVEGRWGPIRYLTGINDRGAIAGVVVLEYSENRGRPIAKPRFLKQYFGKTTTDPVRLRKDIDGVTGATVSSRAITDGVRKNLHILKVISVKPDSLACSS